MSDSKLQILLTFTRHLGRREISGKELIPYKIPHLCSGLHDIT